MAVPKSRIILSYMNLYRPLPGMGRTGTGFILAPFLAAKARRKTHLICLWLFFCAVLGLQIGLAADQALPGGLSENDYKFISVVLPDSQMQMDLGQLALQKSVSPTVREFGRRMANDHGQTIIELKLLLHQKNAVIPVLTNLENTKKEAELVHLKGVDFDRAYLKRMIKDHEEVLATFQSEIDKVDDVGLKSWIVTTLPTIQEHLSLAKSAIEASDASDASRQ